MTSKLIFSVLEWKRDLKLAHRIFCSTNNLIGLVDMIGSFGNKGMGWYIIDQA